MTENGCLCRNFQVFWSLPVGIPPSTKALRKQKPIKIAAVWRWKHSAVLCCVSSYSDKKKLQDYLMKNASLDGRHVAYLILTDKPFKISTWPTVVSCKRRNSTFSVRICGFQQGVSRSRARWWETLLSVSGRHKSPSHSLILWGRVWIIHTYILWSFLFLWFNAASTHTKLL